MNTRLVLTSPFKKILTISNESVHVITVYNPKNINNEIRDGFFFSRKNS